MFQGVTGRLWDFPFKVMIIFMHKIPPCFNLWAFSIYAPAVHGIKLDSSVFRETLVENPTRPTEVFITDISKGENNVKKCENNKKSREQLRGKAWKLSERIAGRSA